MQSPKSPVKPKPHSRASPKQHYSYKSKLYEVAQPIPSVLTQPHLLNANPNTSLFEQKLGVTRAKDPVVEAMVNGLEEGLVNGVRDDGGVDKVNRSMLELRKSYTTSKKKLVSTSKETIKEANSKELKLPPIRKLSSPFNPEEIANPTSTLTGQQRKNAEIFYQSKVERAFRLKENNYLMNLARQHFLQSVEAIKIGKNLKLGEPAKILALSKKNPKFKTIFLDLDETLIHCDESSNNYTVKLNFPVEGGSTIQAGIRVRPYCQQFLEQLSSFAQIIIFTASAPSYADVVLDYLDPKKKYFAHRLYRQHCTLEKGFYTKDLRIVNRRPEDVAIVDNSAFSFMTQPQFGIPCLPFYHFAKDKQLLSLLRFFKQLVQEADMRQKIRQTFFWEKYANESNPHKVFTENFSNI